MNILDAENCFKKGLVALVEDSPDKAAALFESAIRHERQRGCEEPQMRYLSYYGLSVARARGVSRDAIRACRTAAQKDFFNPDLQLNLGRVYLLAGRITPALAAFERGLNLCPDHPALRSEMNRIDRRRNPIVRSLPRNHPLNLMLGRLRARTSRWGVPRAAATAS
jgi:tetratricopeptide (TPR) repeat protein